MEKFCKLTGVELTEEQQCPIKKMCLNCKSLTEEASGTFTCNNETVMGTYKKKILEAVPEGIEIESLTLKPMVLKDPRKKCPNYAADVESIQAEITKIFN